jgi:hypothetical protein
MRWIVTAVAFGLTVSAPVAAFAQQKPDVSGSPSAQSSGAGIPSQPGNQSGPAVKPAEGTVGQTAPDQQNTTVQQQDSSKVKGLPGNKSGPPAKPPKE